MNLPYSKLYVGNTKFAYQSGKIFPDGSIYKQHCIWFVNGSQESCYLSFTFENSLTYASQDSKMTNEE